MLLYTKPIVHDLRLQNMSTEQFDEGINSISMSHWEDELRSCTILIM